MSRGMNGNLRLAIGPATAPAAQGFRQQSHGHLHHMAHLEPRWPATDTEQARPSTVRPDTTTDELHEFLDSVDSESTECRVVVQRAGGKRRCTGSAGTTVILIGLLWMLAMCMAITVMTTYYSAYCLVKHRVTDTVCSNYTSFRVAPEPFLQLSIRFTLSAVSVSTIALLLVMLAKSSGWTVANESEHFDILPLSMIRRNVLMTRKFWIQLFLLLCGVGFNSYVGFYRIQPADGHIVDSAYHIQSDAVDYIRWDYTAAIVEKVMLFAVMCVGNYAQPSNRAPRLTLLTFYATMLYLSVSNCVQFASYSYQLSIKVLPGHHKSITGLAPAADWGTKRKRISDMVFFILLILNTMLRASYWDFFTQKTFEPSKDFFHCVHHPIPQPELPPDQTASGEQLTGNGGNESQPRKIRLLPLMRRSTSHDRPSMPTIDE